MYTTKIGPEWCFGSRGTRSTVFDVYRIDKSVSVLIPGVDLSLLGAIREIESRDCGRVALRWHSSYSFKECKTVEITLKNGHSLFLLFEFINSRLSSLSLILGDSDRDNRSYTDPIDILGRPEIVDQYFLKVSGFPDVSK